MHVKMKREKQALHFNFNLFCRMDLGTNQVQSSWEKLTRLNLISIQTHKSANSNEEAKIRWMADADGGLIEFWNSIYAFEFIVTKHAVIMQMHVCKVLQT